MVHIYNIRKQSTFVPKPGSSPKQFAPQEHQSHVYIDTVQISRACVYIDTVHMYYFFKTERKYIYYPLRTSVLQSVCARATRSRTLPIYNALEACAGPMHVRKREAAREPDGRSPVRTSKLHVRPPGPMRPRSSASHSAAWWRWHACHASIAAASWK